MQVIRISPSIKEPDTYEEWLKEYEKNVIEPFRNEVKFLNKEKMVEWRLRWKAIIDEKYRMIDHYDYRLPEMSKINHVEITCHIEL